MSQLTHTETSPWPKLGADYELRTVVEFQPKSPKPVVTPEFDQPSLLPTPTKNRKILLKVGLVLAAFDLCILPISFFYSLTYGSRLSEQNVFVIITCLFCLMTFAHYTHRCIRLILECSSRYGPVGWRRKWRLLEFTNVNFAICATLFETVLIIGTWPKKPNIRLCAMVSSIMCYYIGTVFLATAIMTHCGFRLPFSMSSTPKGAAYVPALLAMLEDTGAIEARGEVAHREAVLKRYQNSPLFRKMLLQLTWLWGFGLMGVAAITTILIAVLDENIAFGVGWGIPYVWVAVFGAISVRFVNRSLDEERRAFQSRRAPACAVPYEGV